MSNTSNLLPLPVKIDADPDAGFTKLIVGHSHFALNPRKGTVTTVSHQVVPITELLSSVPAQKALARKARPSDPCDDRRGGSKGERSAMKTFHVDDENRILALGARLFEANGTLRRTSWDRVLNWGGNKKVEVTAPP